MSLLFIPFVSHLAVPESLKIELPVAASLQWHGRHEKWLSTFEEGNATQYILVMVYP